MGNPSLLIHHDWLQGVEQNRDLVMATDPARSGPLTVRLNDGARHFSDLPNTSEIAYLVGVETDGRDLVFRFDIPEGAPRVWQRDPSGRMVRVEEAAPA